MRSLAILLLLLPVAAAAGQEQPRPKPPLPDDVAAIVYDELISMDEFQGSLVRRYGRTEDGKQALENLVEKIVVDSERDRRGVEVSEEELQAYVKKTEREVERYSKHTQTLKDLLKEKDVTWEEFLESSRDYLVRQKMAAADLGVSGEVDPAQLGIWVADLKRKRGAVVGGKGLPAGAFARIGDRLIGTRELGAALLDTLPRSALEGALWDLVISRAVMRQLRSEKIEITDADMTAAVAELEREFRDDPRFANTKLTFAQYVKGVRHLTIEELKGDPLFRAQVGLAKSIRRRATADEVRDYYEQNKGRYGERRRFIHLLIKADDRPETSVRRVRSFKEAKTMIDDFLRQYREGAPFEKLVKLHSEDRSKFSAPDRVIEVTRESHLPEALRDTVFGAPVGEVVGPVRTPFGFHLLKVTDARPAPTFEEVRPEVTGDLVRERRTRELLAIRQDEHIRLRY